IFEALLPLLPLPLSLETPANSLDDFPPPLPQAVCEIQLDSEAYEDPHSRSSSKFSSAKERPVQPIWWVVRYWLLDPNETNLPSIMGVQLQLARSFGKQPSPGWPLPIKTLSLIHSPVSGTQGLEKKVSAGHRKISQEIVHQNKSLAVILDPGSRIKTTMDLMEGLFPRDVNLVKENSIKRKAMETAANCPGCKDMKSEEKETVGMLVNYLAISFPRHGPWHSPQTLQAELLQGDVFSVVFIQH
uniref:ASD2 domain-containing protein n=1 Tax=Loxodonta africana TaxID=9785 RepID=G3U5T7_LOXAF